MFAKSRRILLIGLLISLAGAVALPPAPIRAQSTDDYFAEDDEFFQEDDPFQQQDEFGNPVDDFTEGGEFVDETELEGDGPTLSGRQAQLRLLGERELLPQNAAWGAGTGLLIGGWFALINQGTNRETQRSLGLGVVVGTLVGLAVGARTLIAPAAPQPVGAVMPWGDGADRSVMASSAPAFSPISLSFFNYRF